MSYSYLGHIISQINNDYEGVGMSVDYVKPTCIYRNEKTKWGVDVLFKQSLNCSVTPLSSFSNQHVQVIKIALEILLIIVNVYLPSTSLPELKYDETLSLISTSITTYRNEAAILMAGDWNSSLYRQTVCDKKF